MICNKRYIHCHWWLLLSYPCVWYCPPLDISAPTLSSHQESPGSGSDSARLRLRQLSSDRHWGSNTAPSLYISLYILLLLILCHLSESEPNKELEQELNDGIILCVFSVELDNVESYFESFMSLFNSKTNFILLIFAENVIVMISDKSSSVTPAVSENDIKHLCDSWAAI